MGVLVLSKLRRVGMVIAAGLLWSALSDGANPGAATAADSIVIVANQRYPASRLTREEVREIYLGRKVIEQYLRIRPIDQSDPVIRMAFLQTVLELSREAYIDHWNRLIFQQGGLPPLLKDSDDDVIKELLKTDGAIGYLWSHDAEGRPDLKILLMLPVR